MSVDLGTVLFSLPAFLLVLVRMVGCITFNPFLSRRNMPMGIKSALAFFLALILTPLQPLQSVANFNTLDLLFGLFKELFIGYVCGFIFIIFYYLIFSVGDLMDMQMGFSMAKVMDPTTNLQSSLSGTLISMVFVLFFFSTDCHLILIQMFAKSFEIIPLSGGINFAGIPGFILTLFVETFALSLKLALPFIAAELVIELALGVLMKLIPQIHIFVINMQLKIFIGCVTMILFAGPISGFLDKYLNVLMREVENALVLMGS